MIIFLVIILRSQITGSKAKDLVHCHPEDWENQHLSLKSMERKWFLPLPALILCIVMISLILDYLLGLKKVDYIIVVDLYIILILLANIFFMVLVIRIF